MNNKKGYVKNLIIYDKKKINNLSSELKKKGISVIDYIKNCTRRFTALVTVLSMLTTGVALADTVTTKSGNSYIRSGKGTEYNDLGKLHSGDIGYRVIKDDESNWHLVVSGDKIGWVHGQNLKEVNDDSSVYDINPIEEGTTHIHQNVSGSRVYLRSGPGESYTPVTYEMIQPNDYVYVYGETSNGWKLVETYDKKYGYVYGDLFWNSIYYEMPEKDYSLDIIDNRLGEIPEYIYVSRDDVRLRSGPSLDAKKIRNLNRGAKLKLLSNDGYWLKVIDDKNNTAFISSEMVASNPNSLYRDDFLCVIMAKTATSLRRTPDDSSDLNIAYNISKYETCEVLGVEDGWLKVRMNKDVGYVKSDIRLFSKLSGISYVVDKGEKKLTVYNDNVILYECPVSTAMKGCITPDGIGRIVEKQELTYFTSTEYGYKDYPAYWASRIEYVDDNGKPIKDKDHTGDWFHKGSVKIESHGCTHLEEKDAKWVYNNIAPYEDRVVYHR